MTHVVLSVGTNNNRKYNIRKAVRRIRDVYGNVEISPVYETDSAGFSGHAFYNLVIGIHSDQTPDRIQEAMHAIEIHAGRIRGKKDHSNRVLDIDLLLYGDQVFHPRLNIPRDEIERYAFVLKPLSDLYPDRRHPVSDRSFLEMWESFDGPLYNLTPIQLEMCFTDREESVPEPGTESGPVWRSV